MRTCLVELTVSKNKIVDFEKIESVSDSGQNN